MPNIKNIDIPGALRTPRSIDGISAGILFVLVDVKVLQGYTNERSRNPEIKCHLGGPYLITRVTTIY
jgi:hypothetical protein